MSVTHFARESCSIEANMGARVQNQTIFTEGVKLANQGGRRDLAIACVCVYGLVVVFAFMSVCTFIMYWRTFTSTQLLQQGQYCHIVWWHTWLLSCPVERYWHCQCVCGRTQLHPCHRIHPLFPLQIGVLTRLLLYLCISYWHPHCVCKHIRLCGHISMW
jgi:hypothetical protein